VERTLAGLSLEQKVGQLIGIRCPGRFLNRRDPAFLELSRLVVERGVGSLVLFAGDVYETAFLTNALQSLADVPLLVASDFERGAGSHIEGATLFPPLMALGAIDSEDTAYTMGRITAQEGRAVGVHLVYAPVMDVNVNPANPIINVRSAGEDPEEVSRIGRAFIRGCQENGMLATAKHFPGHGDTELDSHISLAVVPGDRERLEQIELYPFRQAVNAGVHAIMVSHLEVPALDPNPRTPATLSPLIVTGLLRERMGFQGLIISDAMEMGGITTLYPPGEAAVKAVQAGIDMVLLPSDADRAIDALVVAVRSGAVSRRRIDESVRRILTSKAALGLPHRRLVETGGLDRLIAAPESLAVARKAYEDAVTLVKNDGPVLPLRDNGGKLTVFSLSSDPGGYFAGRPLVDEIRGRLKNPGRDLRAFYAEASTGREFIETAVGDASGATTALVALFSRVASSKGTADLNPGHVRAVKDLIATGVPVVVVSFGSPYFLEHFPEAAAYVCVYRPTAEAQAAAARVLFGEIDARGKLPVTLPGLYPRGHGLRLGPEGREVRPRTRPTAGG
jgi:beta-N-acetylhexosaminidase